MSDEEREEEATPSFTPAQQPWIKQLIAEKVAHIAPLTSTITSASTVPISNAGGVGGKSKDSASPRIVQTQQSWAIVSVHVHDVCIRAQS